MPESGKTPPKKGEKGTPRLHLADLFRIPKYYRMKDGASMEKPEFSLVDEKPTHPMLSHIEGDHDYTRDELIAAIGRAYPQMTDLLKELDSFRGLYFSMKELVAEMFYRVMARKLHPSDANLAHIVGEQATFGRQCMDVIRNIALHAPAENCKEIAQKLLKKFEPVDLNDKKIITLVDEKNENGKPPQASSN